MRRFGSVVILLSVLIHLAGCAPPAYQGNAPAGGAGGGQPPQPPQSTTVPLPGSPSGAQAPTAAPVAPEQQAPPAPTERPWWSPPSNAPAPGSVSEHPEGPTAEPGSGWFPQPPQHLGEDSHEIPLTAEELDAHQRRNQEAEAFFDKHPYFFMSKEEQEAVLFAYLEKIDLQGYVDDLRNVDVGRMFQDLLQRGREIVSTDAEPPAPPPPAVGPVSPEGLICPISGGPVRMTQGYGVGTHAPGPIWGGIDLARSPGGGEELVAVTDGVIKLYGNSYPGGYGIALRASNGHTYRYFHMRAEGYAAGLVDGQPVTRGTRLGYLGATGNVTGPHLHFEWQHSGANQDPYNLFKGVCGY